MKINKIISSVVKQCSELVSSTGAQKLERTASAQVEKTSGLVTNPMKNLNSDVVQLSKETMLERSLNSSHPIKPIQVTTTEGTIAKWQRYVGSQMGSQDAFWAKNEATGELFYVKFANDTQKEGHIASEILASKLYKLAGVETPEVIPITLNGKIKALASKQVPNLTETTDVKLLQRGFAADAWLANWDSLLPGNTMVQGKTLVKIDNGGALRYRARGRLKEDFGNRPTELITLVDGRNYDSTIVYSGMNQRDLIESFNSVCRIPDKEILKIVEDKTLAQTLINRKNYMKEVLEEVKNTQKADYEDLSDYFLKIMRKIDARRIFNPEVITDELSQTLNRRITYNSLTVNLPATRTVAKDLIAQIKMLEKNGVQISKEDIDTLLREIVENGFDLDPRKYTGMFKYVCEFEEHYNKMFSQLLKFAQTIPKKEGETAHAYLSRLVKMRERRLKQLDDFRIKMIKSKLLYEPEIKVSTTSVLTPSQRQAAISELEAARLDNESLEIMTIPKLSANSTDKEIYHAWQMAHMGSFEFSTNELQKSVMALGGRYNSKHPIKTKTLYETIADKDYKQEFDIEPVYHWFGKSKPEEFVMREIPKKGEIYTLPDLHCCSSHKTYAEDCFGDHISSQNIKFVMHPKSETSQAYNLGYNQEVVYPAGQQFRILDKELVEHIDPSTGAGYLRWEIHMQEV